MDKTGYEFQRQQGGELGREFDQFESQEHSRLGIFLPNPVFQMLK